MEGLERGTSRARFAHSRKKNSAKAVQWAFHTQTALVHHMGVNHRRCYIFMSKEFLHSTDIITCLQQMRGKAVTKSMRTDGFGKVRHSGRLLHCPL